MDGNESIGVVRSRRLWHILVIAGVIVVVLVVVLITMLTSDDAQKRAKSGVADIVVPESQFVYDSNEEYGGALNFSSEIKNTILYGLSERAYDEITKRISAWFAVEYPKYESFGLVKDSYKKKETEKKVKVVAKMVSNFGTIVGFEMIDELDGLFTIKTTIRLLTSAGEEAYKTDIIWEDLDV